MVSPDGVVPSRFVCVSASVNLPLLHKVQKFSSGIGHPGGPGKRAVKRLWWFRCLLCVFAILFLCRLRFCIRFNFFSTKSRDWLGKTSVK